MIKKILEQRNIFFNYCKKNEKITLYKNIRIYTKMDTKMDTKMNEMIKKYMDKYKEFVGVEPNNNSKYDEESFLEIMARSLAF